MPVGQRGVWVALRFPRAMPEATLIMAVGQFVGEVCGLGRVGDDGSDGGHDGAEAEVMAGVVGEMTPKICSKWQ